MQLREKVSKVSQLIDLFKDRFIISKQLYTSLNSCINTLDHLLNTFGDEQVQPATKLKLMKILTKTQSLLDELYNDSGSVYIFEIIKISTIRHFFPGSSAWMLEDLIPTFLELSDKILVENREYNIQESNLNKRKLERAAQEEEYEPIGLKKPHTIREKPVLRELAVTKTENISIDSVRLSDISNSGKGSGKKSGDKVDMRIEMKEKENALENKENDQAQHEANISRGAASYGTLTTDTVVKIGAHTILEDKKPEDCSIKRLFFKVEWKQREDGIQPEASFYSYNILKKKAPGVILDYIENVIQLD